MGPARRWGRRSHVANKPFDEDPAHLQVLLVSGHVLAKRFPVTAKILVASQGAVHSLAPHLPIAIDSPSAAPMSSRMNAAGEQPGPVGPCNQRLSSRSVEVASDMIRRHAPDNRFSTERRPHSS